MLAADSAVKIKRVKKFLNIVKRMKDSALIFSSPETKSLIIKEIKKAFSGKKTHFIDPTMREKEEIDKTFVASLKEGSLLLVSLDRNSLPTVMRRLEQVMEDGYVQVNISGTWRKVEPTDTWQTIVWINSKNAREDEFTLNLLFTHKLMME